MLPVFPQFPSYRPHQEEVVEQVMDLVSDTIIETKAVMVEGPTGSGKSLVGMSIGKLAEKTLYLCTTKTLQEQIVHDYPGIPLLKGRSNYQCDTRPGTFPLISAEDCTAGDMDDLGREAFKAHCRDEQGDAHG